MKKLIVDQKVSSTREFKRYFSAYVRKKGYEYDYNELPTDILRELIPGALICFTALDLKVDEEFEVQLYPELSFQCVKKGKYNLELDIAYMKSMLGITGHDPMEEVLFNPTNYKQLVKYEPFYHPLAEAFNIDNPNKCTLNTYAFAATIINAIWDPEFADDQGANATQLLRELVLENDRIVNVEALIHKIKAGYLASMMEAANIIHNSLTAKLDKEFGV